ncbi:PAB-dependent poly(A)-specific ribonuclease subunit 3 [Xylographa opegraphella]|nr:PAB-dependent poly(A)-specific ribonuclease subunit 3 [Xylographa opegraphella]
METKALSNAQNRISPQVLRPTRPPTPGSWSPKSSNPWTRTARYRKFAKVNLSDNAVVKIGFHQSTVPASSIRPLKHSKSMSMDAKPFVPSHDHCCTHKESLAIPVYSPPDTDGFYNRVNHNYPPEHSGVSLSPFHDLSEHAKKIRSHQFSSRHTSTQLNPAQLSIQVETTGGLSQPLYDPYVTPPSSMATPAQTSQLNPYTQDSNPNGSTSYYQASSFAQPVQYHLYTSLGPHREALLPYQKAAHDFFIPDALREELQRKSATTLQTLPNSTLPPQIDHFHSLVPLDTNSQKNATIFGYPSWIYKAVSSKDGNTYALRRLEGYRLTNEKAIRSVQSWKRVISGNVVTVIDAFTNRSFGDSSLIFITDYHPCSKTLAETHFNSSARFNNRVQDVRVNEQVLWGYTIQVANALKTIHSAGLAARVIDATKILVTSKNRIRLNACAILDVVQHDSNRSVVELQREDLVQFGRLLLAIGTNNSTVNHSLSKAIDQFTRSYSTQLKEKILGLLGLGAGKIDSIDNFLVGLESQLMSTFDFALHHDDELTSTLNRELENSRLVRLMTKFNFILERPEYSHQWAETGERWPIKLFRDYVFHQVDAQGSPTLDLGHVIGCLNKLDAGSEEKIVLTTRDDQVCIVVSFKEMKRAVESAYADLAKVGRRAL